LLQINVSPEEWKEVAAAAEHIEIPVNTLARALFRWVFPLLRSCGFSVAEVKRRFGEGDNLVANANRTSPDDKIREWLYRLYLATPEDERNLFRGLAEKIHFPIPAPEELGAFPGKSEGPEASDQRNRRTVGRRSAR